MRRTVDFGYKAAVEWDKLAGDEVPDLTPDWAEGRHAYAVEQADTEHVRCGRLESQWRGILLKADAYLDGSVQLTADDAVTVELDVGDELDAEEEEARLEGEEEGLLEGEVQ
jgi:hypothetical protein